MKAMIFAAGFGTRLKPFTLHHPKALVPVDGKPMLRRVIENIAAAGVTEIVVNVHNFADQIENYLAENHNFGLDIRISDERALLLDTGGGLLKAADILKSMGRPYDPILLHNADILTDLPLAQMCRYHEQSGADATLLCSHRESSRTLWFDSAESTLRGWQNRSTGEYRPATFTPSASDDATPFDGIHIINPAILDLLEKYNGGADAKPFSIIPFYLSVLGKAKIRRFLLPEGCQWLDVGSSEKLQAAEAALNH